MNKKMLKNTEWAILICSVILLVIGTIALFSATVDTEHEEFKKQIIWISISIPVMILVYFIDYELIAKLSPFLYGIFIILLIAVLFTESINGATSWFDIGFFSFQPAEFAKIAVILFLAYMIVKFQKKGIKQINKIWKLAVLLLIVLVPVGLIVLQPDYGTALAFIVSAAVMFFVGGINKTYIIVTLLLIVISVPLLYFFVLPDHAKTRIDVFLDPTIDPRGAGYNVIQSKLAIGAGQLGGMGLLKGNQTQLGFLYPKTTDFIFSVIGEEMGFLIAGIVILLYVTIIVKGIYVAKTAKNNLGSYIAIGIVRNIYISYDRKYRNDYGLITNNRSAIIIIKLWWKLSNNQFYINRLIIKYKFEKEESNIYSIIVILFVNYFTY